MKIKIKLSRNFEREWEYKKEQLAADLKLKQVQVALEKRRVTIQEQQIELQLQMMKALIQSKKDN